jgi:hypothetical protein
LAIRSFVAPARGRGRDEPARAAVLLHVEGRTGRRHLDGERERQRAIFSTLPGIADTYADTVRAAWDVMSAPQHEPVFRLFFEVYGLALQDPNDFPVS